MEKKRDKLRRLSAIGKIGGAIGGPARAAVLTSERRKEIAVGAANARWRNKKMAE